MQIDRSLLLLIVKELNRKYMSGCRDSRGTDFFIDFKKLLNGVHILGYDGTKHTRCSAMWFHIKILLEKISYSEVLDLCIELKLIKRSYFLIKNTHLTELNSTLKYARGVYYKKTVFSSNFTEGGKLYEESRRYGVDLVSPHNKSLVLGKIFDIEMTRTDNIDKETEKYIYQLTGRVLLTEDGCLLSNISKYDANKPIALFSINSNRIQIHLTDRLHFKYIEKGVPVNG